MRLPGGLPGAVALAVAACARGGESRLEATWTADSVEVRLAGPAAAVACDGARLLVTAMAGDTGVGVLLAAGDSGGPVAAGRYPVADPGAGPLPRPGAALALRMPGEGGSRGFQGRDGAVELASAGTGWEGRLEGRLVSLDEAETLAVTGRFRVAGPVPPGTCDDPEAPGPSGEDPPPEPADSGAPGLP